MTTEKIQPKENWYKCSDTSRTEIRAFKSYLDENNKPVKIGGYDIEMGFCVHDSWCDLYIDVSDENNKVVHQVVIKTTLDQIIKLKPTRLAFYIKEEDKKKYNHSVKMGRFRIFDNKKNNSLEENLRQVDLEELIKEKEGV